jgi:hypothetical protein
VGALPILFKKTRTKLYELRLRISHPLQDIPEAAGAPSIMIGMMGSLFHLFLFPSDGNPAVAMICMLFVQKLFSRDCPN